ncbi:uncharacterized protein YlxW (UPF0749 family) [Flavimobilis soli]|uniref:Uncharacterized protein YlxW (UPF0749 family) n=1 Tax=Flavimobilis soli TaxID=442709 RepID=A0A2A9EE95_9MICO|nr:DUF881 domain-containing protein [Flavimobilis soli]PFG36881.1 uncharacterized protein YlxW (UPF0749 family) [Flavimobilis soli]
MRDVVAGGQRPVRATVAVTLVLALAGLLFTANARLSRSGGERHATNLAELVEIENDRVRELGEQVDQITAEIDTILANPTDVDAPGETAVAQRDAIVAGTVAVTGPGLRVTLDDAPASTPLSATVRPDSLVVHQQDLEAVINALWAGGAEAMTLQGQRVTVSTAFRCVGNVLSLGGRVYSPPYRVEAIGDPNALTAALDASREIQVYRQWVDQVGLGWSVDVVDTLQVPAGSLPAELAQADVPSGVDVLP